MILAVALGILALVAAFALIVATRPSPFRVERSIVIAAPAESAFAQVNDFRAWTAWSPYERLDPGMARSFGGAPCGVGATYAWSGNGEAGEGRMTIEESELPARIAIRLEFARPFTVTHRVTFTFAAVPGGTMVTWAMEGRSTFASRASALVMDLDRVVGESFEQGLGALKSGTELARAR